MRLTQYVPLALRTEKHLSTFDRLIHGCMGLITEIGEVVSELKRIEIYGKPLDEKRKVHLLEEAGDVMWYTAILLDALDADLETFRVTPSQRMPDHTEGKFQALSLMLGEHCGRVCALTQQFCMYEASETDYGMLLSSLTMICSGMTVLALSCDSTLEQAMDNNIAKLKLRYADKYSNEAATERADKVGGEVY